MKILTSVFNGIRITIGFVAFFAAWIPAIPFLLICKAARIDPPLNPFGDIYGEP